MVRSRSGFTLIELLVVIGIIGLLASIVLVSLASARQKGKVSRAASTVHQIDNALELFAAKNGDYPPVGADHCDMCTYWPPAQQWVQGTWSDIVNLLITDGDINSAGNGFQTDPWGNPYLYDKNYEQPCYGLSPICSMGPDGTLETSNCPTDPVAVGDDICVFISNG